jgi:hypothetical protein
VQVTLLSESRLPSASGAGLGTETADQLVPFQLWTWLTVAVVDESSSSPTAQQLLDDVHQTALSEFVLPGLDMSFAAGAMTDAPAA